MSGSKLLINFLLIGILLGCASRIGTKTQKLTVEEYLKTDVLAGNEQKLLERALPALGKVGRVIFPGDELTIEIFEKLPVSPDLRTEKKKVDPNGEIHLLPMGMVKIAGLTVREANDYLREALSEYIVSPYCEVTVTGSERRVFVFGEVKEPGAKELGPAYTLLDVLALAKSSEDPYGWDLKVIRAEAGKIKIISVNLKDIFKQGKVYHNIPMENNDIVYVPRRLMRDVRDILRDLSVVLPWYFFVRSVQQG